MQNKPTKRELLGDITAMLCIFIMGALLIVGDAAYGTGHYEAGLRGGMHNEWHIKD